MKLQAVKISNFKGDYPEEWQPLWKHFSSIIQNNDAGKDKIQYLYMYLEGSALELVGGWSKTVAYYSAVFEILENTFGSPDEMKCPLCRV